MGWCLSVSLAFIVRNKIFVVQKYIKYVLHCSRGTVTIVLVGVCQTYKLLLKTNHQHLNEIPKFKH